MQPSSMGYFSLATIGESSCRAACGGRAGASREKVSSAAWLTCERGGEEGRREREEEGKGKCCSEQVRGGEGGRGRGEGKGGGEGGEEERGGKGRSW